MDEKEIKIMLEAVRHARDVIGLVARHKGKYGYDDFVNPAVRDMFYDLNQMCEYLGEMKENVGG
jgi:hypothetical protein